MVLQSNDNIFLHENSYETSGATRFMLLHKALVRVSARKCYKTTLVQRKIMLLHHQFADRRIGFVAKTSVQIVFPWKETKIREEQSAEAL